MSARIDYAAMVGRTFGSWTVRSVRMPTHAGARARFGVACSCGALDEVDAHSVVSGASQRCRECAKRFRGPRAGHGATSGRKVTPEWNAWRGMLERCTNPKHRAWARYGGRGIQVCDRWRDSFANFLADMGERPSAEHTLDRKDNDGNYEPGNCRWATPEEQARNRRSTRLITIGGETLCAEDWARRTGVPASTIYDRLRRGVAPELAVQP